MIAIKNFQQEIIDDGVLLEPSEVFVRIAKEIFSLFNLQLDEKNDGLNLKIRHEIFRKPKLFVKTELAINGEKFFCEKYAHEDEIPRAEVHRLAKLNFYELLKKNPAIQKFSPWGILHGVRPNKIVQRYIDRQKNITQAEMIQRLRDDYDVSETKAKLLTDISFLQQPFLQDHDPKKISIYVGIPFCSSRCLYCSFPSNVLQMDKLKRFMTVFEKDLFAVRDAIQKYNLNLETIYIGGGTPTSLPNDFFERMLGLVYENFYSAKIKEFTVEAGRPDTITDEKIRCMKNLHVSRVSVNPQTMQERTLRFIGRQHTPEDIIEMFYKLRQEKIFSLNMDLIVGLPAETVDDMKDTIEKILQLAPDDITLHTLALKRGSRLKEKLDEHETIKLPDDETARSMFDLATKKILEKNYVPYYLYRQGYQMGDLENVGYCQPGHESLYNIKIMSEQQTILGIGGAATSKIINPKTGRLNSSFNPKDLTLYLEKIDDYILKREKLLQEAFA